ncbi:hypothetical protein IFT48_03425 [Pseudomonas fluorescens]|uniref:hypothetical protein n=1 Tax=Pseudomonas fluorescens TaxID=294 RepID=UPI0019308DE9|nr:hypothetical protein [Pseudomonas fluorescens]MBD8089020.1 hypothetical protein [Pseudomonas fluorescens]
MSLAHYIKFRLRKNPYKNKKPLLTDEQVLGDPSLALCAQSIKNIGALPQEEQARVFTTVVKNNLWLHELALIHFTLQTSAYEPLNALNGYVWHKAEAIKFEQPVREEEVILREHLKSLGPEAMIKHCKRHDLKVAFGEIFGKAQAIKAFGRDYEHTIDMEM